MVNINRRGFLVSTAGLAGAGLVNAACTPDGESAIGDECGPTAECAESPLAVPRSAGLMDEELFQQRIDEYLKFATTEFDPGNATGVVAQLIRAQREDDYTWNSSQVSAESFAELWEKLDGWEDTRDFDIMYLLWMLKLGDPAVNGADGPMTTISPDLIAAIEQRLVDNRYRYNDPNPDGRLDDLWYWSENHIVIDAVIEHLAGQRLPDETFTITGLTGTEHMERSKPVILDWVHERARFGFFEWHSNVYMLKNITPMITLAELADDKELVQAAGMALDLCLVDVACHTHAGSYTAPRGRTYKKDKMTSRDEATFGVAKFIFDDTEFEYQSHTDTGTTYLCAMNRYRPPQAIIDMATAPSPGVVKERHGIYVDYAAPVTENPEAPFGYDFDDPANLPFWWSTGGVGMWQVAEVGLAEAEKYNLFASPQLAEVKALVEINGGDIDRIQPWLQKNRAIVNFGFLAEANTYAWRGDEVSLASVQDHRFGEMRDQVHSWQAAIDADAVVFTTHPVTPPEVSTEWRDDPGPGYWTGEASLPRSAQHERAAIHIYQPAWDETTDELLWGVFGYQPFTHAFVPQDRFDEVTQDGKWTFARKGDGWIALWSWREPKFRVYDPTKLATDGMEQPFDLIADGGPDNVWVVEVGEAADDSFGDWKASLLAAEPQVEQDDGGFTVEFESPSAGAMTFGSTAPFTVAGDEVALDEFPRHESAFGTVERLDTTLAFDTKNATLKLDFDGATRELS